MGSIKITVLHDGEERSRFVSADAVDRMEKYEVQQFMGNVVIKLLQNMRMHVAGDRTGHG